MHILRSSLVVKEENEEYKDHENLTSWTKCEIRVNSQTIIFHSLSIFQFIDFRIHEKRPFEFTKSKLLQLLWTTCIFGQLIMKLFDLNYDWGKKGVGGVGESACSYKLNVTSKIWLPIMSFIKSILVSFSCFASLKCLRLHWRWMQSCCKQLHVKVFEIHVHAVAATTTNSSNN